MIKPKEEQQIDTTPEAGQLGVLVWSQGLFLLFTVLVETFKRGRSDESLHLRFP